MTDTVFQVAIVGGGIAGLAAASVLRKKHKVTIFERNAKDVPESGAAVGLGPNGSKMALALGLSQEGLRGVVSQGIKTYDQHENKLNETGLDYAKIFGSEWWFVHRQDLKDCLLEIVQDGFKGKNVDIRYEANVTGVDWQAGLVFFADGTSFHADLIIGADGIHSKVRNSVVEHNHMSPVHANLSLYRFVLPRHEVQEKLAANNISRLAFEDGSYLTMFVATDGTNRNAVMYPCRNMEVINFAFAVPDTLLKQKTSQSWSLDGDLEEMRQSFADFPAWFQLVFSLVKSVKIYQLWDYDPIPDYIRGSTALIGDAAHPMVPYQGQGANQALEDAEGLSILNADNLRKEQISKVLQKWQLIRQPRASQVQLNSRVASRDMKPEAILQKMQFNWTYSGIDNALSDIQSIIDNK